MFFYRPAGQVKSGQRKIPRTPDSNARLRTSLLQCRAICDLSSGGESLYTGVAIVIGAETSEISVSRHGIELAAETIPIGANWIDTELARQYEIWTWDETGECLSGSGGSSGVEAQLTDAFEKLASGERARTLARLYGAVLNQIARSTRKLINSPGRYISPQRQSAGGILCRGPTQIGELCQHVDRAFCRARNGGSDSFGPHRGQRRNGGRSSLLIQGELEERRLSAAGTGRIKLSANQSRSI